MAIGGAYRFTVIGAKPTVFLHMLAFLLGTVYSV